MQANLALQHFDTCGQLDEVQAQRERTYIIIIYQEISANIVFEIVVFINTVFKFKPI